MAKQAPDVTLDMMLDGIADVCDVLHVCTTEPANYAGIAALELANVTLTVGDGGGDYVIADDTSGRKLTIAQQADIPIDTSGDAQHIALSDGSAVLYYVTTCTLQALVDTGTVTVPAWKINVADPT
jgi:hypothetical protein